MLFHKIQEFQKYQNSILAHLICKYGISEEIQQNLAIIFDHHIKSMEEANELYRQAGEAISIGQSYKNELELVKSQKLRVCNTTN